MLSTTAVLLASTHVVGALIGSIIGFVIWLLVMAWIYAIARRKGRHAVLWVIFGFFFSLIALIILLLLPNKNKTHAA